jgi:hypothetical protein
MHEEPQHRHLTFGGPAVYRIVVHGDVDPRLCELLGGMRIESRPSGAEHPITTLIGHLKDQAHLAGVLASLSDMRLPIVSVEIIDESDGESTP